MRSAMPSMIVMVPVPQKERFNAEDAEGNTEGAEE
jgi:hypothetical protein